MSNENKKVQLPEGFQRSGSAIGVGFFEMSEIGNTLSGILVGMFEMKTSLRADGKTNFFQVEIDQPCMVRSGRGDDAEVVEAKAGDVVNVNYGPKTRAWEKFIPSIQLGAVYQVYGVVAGNKVELSGGRKMHNFEVGHKLVKASPDDTQTSVPVVTDDVNF